MCVTLTVGYTNICIYSVSSHLPQPEKRLPSRLYQNTGMAEREASGQDFQLITSLRMALHNPGHGVPCPYKNHREHINFTELRFDAIALSIT